MSYVDAILDKNNDRVLVVERINGQRYFQEYKTNYTFYYDDPAGKFKTIYGTPVTRVACKSFKEFSREKSYVAGRRCWESNYNPVSRCLEENYLGSDAPNLQVAFFDIETDFDPARGFSTPEDPFTKITAITVYLQWLEKLVTFAIPPKGLSMTKANEIAEKFENTFMFETEADMLLAFLDVIEDADVITGWNSEGYDIPYTINRITKVLSKDDTRRFCLWNKFPKRRDYQAFGADRVTFDLVGRIHMDYMQLYKKYTYEERHSWSLDAIGEYELNKRKIAYEGTLDQLYNNDFEKFIEYNRVDVLLIAELDDKLKFMDLANQIGHENTVLLPKTLGAVAVTEQAIINHAHSYGLVVPDKVKYAGDTSAPGAYVAYPKKGMHEWIGSIDINSLYPSAIRALNMSNETIVGQLRPSHTDKYIKERMAQKKSFAEAWEGLFGTLEYTAVIERRPDFDIIIDWEDGSQDELTAQEIYRLVFMNDDNWILTANGTIIKTDKKGIIPDLLEKWYSERKVLQAKAAEFNGKDKKEFEFWDKRQLVKKINLNSLYGAILNPHCLFYDKRIGQSTTLTGRTITKHMASFVNEYLTGDYNHVGDAIIYGDTDSVYFSAWPMIKDAVASGEIKWTPEDCIAMYDAIADELNKSFPEMMKKACNCSYENGSIIKGGRETVSTRGIFIVKKRYGIMMIDKDGKRLDQGNQPGKVKAMGMDLKRSDTPKNVQDFLSGLLFDVLSGGTEEDALQTIRDFKQNEFRYNPPWEKGTPKRVNNLTKFTKAYEENGGQGITIPGHVMAAINWNLLKKAYSDNYSMNIVDGQKTIVCKLKPNPLNMKSIGYPVDEEHLPDWFKELPFNESLMEETIVDQKVKNLLGTLNWNLESTEETQDVFNQFFTVG